MSGFQERRPGPQRATPQDVFTYFVLADFGKAGIAWVERNVNDADRRTTVADITSGQWGDVMTILECNPAENICNDVTEELLREAGVLDEPLEPIDAQVERFDHAHDLRKHEAA
jgi:hypothetical protein